MDIFRVFPPLGSVHPASALGFLPNVAKGTEEWVYHQDQVTRYTHWRLGWVDLDSLDLHTPRGSEHGLLVVHPISRTVLGGWGPVRTAQARGQTRVAGYIGADLNPGWLPHSQEEKINQQAFSALSRLWWALDHEIQRAQKVAAQWKHQGLFMGDGIAIPEAKILKTLVEGTPGVDPNAMDASGRTLLMSVLEACWYGDSNLIDTAALLIQKGAVLERRSKIFLSMPGEIQTPLEMLVALLASSLHRGSMVAPLAEAIMEARIGWEKQEVQQLFEGFVKGLDSSQQEVPLCVNRLRTHCRSLLLNQRLPDPAARLPKLRF